MRTFEEIAKLWAVDKKHYVKKSTVSVYVLLLENHLLPIFRNHTEITEGEVQHFVLEKIDSGLSHKTVKDIIIVLNMVLKFGRKYYGTKYSGFDIKYPTTHRKAEIEVLTKAHQKILMNYIKERFSFRALGIYICLSTGMRIGEICALTWEDVDTDEKFININKTIQRVYMVENGKRYTEIVLDTPKTKNSIRKIPMSRELIRLIKPFKKIVNQKFYVLTNDEKHTEPRTYRSYYKKILDKLDIPPMKFHGLRHTFATRCIESKADVKTVATILGHANITTTLNLYTHPTDEQRRGAIEQMFKTLK